MSKECKTFDLCSGTSGHKMKVCLKELRETWVWLQMIKRAKSYEMAIKT